MFEDKLGSRRIVIFCSPEGLSPLDARITDSREAGTIGVFLTECDPRRRFRRNKDQIEDRDTGSVWTITGASASGPQAGAQLDPVEHGVYFAFAWMAFGPDTLVVGGVSSPY